MPYIPAVCENCGRLFPSSFYAESVTNLTISNVSVSPCPYCGAVGHIPDGTYNVVNNVIDYFANSNYSADELIKLRSILIQGISRNKSNTDIVTETEKAGYDLKDLLPRNREEARNDMVALIQIILAILGILIPILMSNQDNTSELNADQVIEYINENPDEFKDFGGDE